MKKPDIGGSQFQNSTEVPAVLITAPFSARLFAFLVDWAILGCVHLLLLYLSGGLLLKLTPLDASSLFHGFGLFFLILFFNPLLLAMVYFLTFHAVTGKTIGKMAMGIQLVSSSGEILAPGRVFLRWVGYFVSALPVAAGFYWAVIDRSHDTWHDKLAGSRVVVSGR
jgi:uncharacterized RDD family membrane protein YckC